MRKSLVLLVVVCFFTLSLTMEQKKSSLIPDKQMMQVGIIVKDIEKSSKAWAEFLGLEKVPESSIAAGSELNPTQYKGAPTDAKAKLAFFELDNITVELIQPIGGPSTWQEFLDTKGEGIHHIAFNVKGMKGQIKNFENSGIPLIQHGGWETGEYSYMDGTNSLALVIELLEHYNQ
ncbi:MAG: VOC family protein [Bacteroidales bacterium]|nr:VOC family protein [Bacteroidales bacterium]